MALSTSVSAVVPATPAVNGVDHLKRFGLTVQFRGLHDSTNLIVLGAALATPAIYGDFSHTETYSLLDATRLSITQPSFRADWLGQAFYDLDGGDWSAGDTLYVCFINSAVIPLPAEPLLAVRGPFVVT